MPIRRIGRKLTIGPVVRSDEVGRASPHWKTATVAPNVASDREQEAQRWP